MLAYLPPIIPQSRRAEDLVLRVQQVATGYERRQFVGVAHQLYRGDHRWIPPLNAARRDALRSERNPLLRHGELGAFIGIAQNLGLGDEVVAALASWTAAGEPEDEEVAWGSWGLFEAINVEDLSDRLFYEAENWLFEHGGGLAGIRGPMSIEPLIPPGLLTDGFDAYPAAFVPHNPPYYPELIEGQGYEPGDTWRVYSLELPSSHFRFRPGARPSATANTWRTVSQAYAAHGTVGPLRVLVPALLPWLNHLGRVERFSFNGGWVRTMGRVFGSALVCVQGRDSEETVACFGVPDVGRALRLSRGRHLTFGWLLFEIGLALTRRLRVFPAAAPEIGDADRLGELYAAVAERATEVGYRQMDIAPIADADERSVQALLAAGARPTQQFTIYEKSL